jgi:hypothetical protein
MTRLMPLLFSTALLAACVGDRPLGQQPHCPCAPGWSCDPTTNLCISNGDGGGAGAPASDIGTGGTNDGGRGAAGNGGSSPELFTAQQVQAALANCDLPHGPPVTIANSNDLKTRVAGAWLVCPASAAGETHTLFSQGIQLEANGRFEVLTPTAEGGLQAGVGVLSQGQWSTFCEQSSTIGGADPCPGVGYDGALVSAQVAGGDKSPTGCFVGPFSFESSPTRAYVLDWPQLYCSVSYTGDPFNFWLVPLR